MATDSLAMSAYKQMKEDIISCELAPGSSHTESELAARYGMSKTPIRFALALLSAENLVEVLPRRGIGIAPLSIADLRSTYAIRELLEPYASSLAATHRTDTDVEMLRESARLSHGDGETPLDREQIRAHANFHILIARATGMPQLARMIQSLHEAMQRLLSTLPAVGQIMRFGDLDAELLDAIERRDARQAEEVTRKGITTSNELTTAVLLGRTTLSPSAVLPTASQAAGTAHAGHTSAPATATRSGPPPEEPPTP